MAEQRLASNPFTAFAIGFKDPAAPGKFRAEQAQLQQQRAAKQLQARVGAAQLVLQNPSAPQAAIDAATGVLEEAGMGGMAAGLRPGGVTITPAGQQPPGGTGAVPAGMTGVTQGGKFALAKTPVAPGSAESTAALRTRRQKINDQMRLNNLTEAQAVDVVDGNKRISRPDAFGNLYLVSTSTGDRELVAGPGTQGPTEPTPVPSSGAPQLTGMQPEEAARVGTGPVARTLQGVSNLFGFMFTGQVAPQTVEARQTLNLFNKTMERSLVNNPRFPVAEQEFVRSLMPSTQQFFTDPDDAVSKVRQLQSYVRNQLSIKQQELAAPGLTSKRKADLSDQVSGLREIQRLFPQGGDPGRFGSMSTEELSNIDIDSLSDAELEAFQNAMNEVPRLQ